jgi:hypothetical protein
MRENTRDTIDRCEDAGYADGLAAGLALALDGTSPGPAPGGIAALPANAVPGGSAVIPHVMAAREGIVFLRQEPAAPATATGPAAFCARLGAARLGVTRRLADCVLAHLTGRSSGGEPILRKQLVQGTLADARVTTEVARRALLVGGASTAAVADVHDRLTVLDWELAKLLGAAGYAGESAAREVFVSRLTAGCWLPRVRVT